MKKKIVLMATSLVLVVAMAVGGTLAYLTSTSETVSNTFSVGQVTITLDETKVTEYGEVDTSATAPVKTNNYKLIPGHNYVKDPTIHVTQGSEPVYLFAKIENGLSAIATINMAANWTYIADDVWAYTPVVDAMTAQQNVTIFTDFTVSGSVTDFTDYANKTIDITGYAIQADGFDSATEAWSNAPASWN